MPNRLPHVSHTVCLVFLRFLYLQSAEIGPEFVEAFNKAYLEFGSLGERVIGCARLRLDERYGPHMDGEYRVEKGNYPSSVSSVVDQPCTVGRSFL